MGLLFSFDMVTVEIKTFWWEVFMRNLCSLLLLDVRNEEFLTLMKPFSNGVLPFIISYLQKDSGSFLRVRFTCCDAAVLLQGDRLKF